MTNGKLQVGERVMASESCRRVAPGSAGIVVGTKGIVFRKHYFVDWDDYGDIGCFSEDELRSFKRMSNDDFSRILSAPNFRFR